MTRLINTTMAALVGLALLGSACQGELKFNHKIPLNEGCCGDTPQVVDGGSEDTGPPPVPSISFNDIQKDMDEPGNNCTGAAPSCHGGAMPKGNVKLKKGAAMDNFMELLLRVNKEMPEQSILIKKIKSEMIAGDADTTHMGGAFCNPGEGTLGPEGCDRWLTWIKCGAKFESVPLDMCGGM